MKSNKHLPFPFNTTLKLSTLVRLACEIEHEEGRSPRCSVNERRADLARVAGHCRTKAAAREAIRAALLGYQPNTNPTNPQP